MVKKITKGKKASAGMATRSPNKSIKVRQAPMAVGLTTHKSRPNIASFGRGVRIQHREFATSLTISGSDGHFTVFPECLAMPGLDVNPAYAQLFPWLNGQASSWEKFRFDRLLFHFQPRQPTTARGRILVYYDYDYDDEVITVKSDFLNAFGATECDVWSPFTVAVDTTRMNDTFPWRFIERSTANRANRELNTVCGGFLVIATDGISVDAYSWDLWVEYVVDFEIERPPEEPVQFLSSGMAAWTKNSVMENPVMLGGNLGELGAVRQSPIVPETDPTMSTIQGSSGQTLGETVVPIRAIKPVGNGRLQFEYLPDDISAPGNQTGFLDVVSGVFTDAFAYVPNPNISMPNQDSQQWGPALAAVQKVGENVYKLVDSLAATGMAIRTLARQVDDLAFSDITHFSFWFDQIQDFVAKNVGCSFVIFQAAVVISVVKFGRLTVRWIPHASFGGLQAVSSNSDRTVTLEMLRAKHNSLSASSPGTSSVKGLPKPSPDQKSAPPSERESLSSCCKPGRGAW